MTAVTRAIQNVIDMQCDEIEKLKSALKAKSDRDYGQLFKDIHEWQLATFPDADADSKYAHLLEEIGELGDDLSKGSEIADCMMLLLGIAMVQGIDPYTELAAKLAVNKARKWAKTEDGAYSKHVEESA